MPKVSIIIPVYNAEKYLSKCLDSIIEQTFKDIEIICINDGSKDKSLEILKTYTQKDERIIIINIPNSGAGFSRNKGLEIANGDFIQFVDADDYLANNQVIEQLYNKAILENVDVILFGYNILEKEKITKINFPNDYIFNKKYNLKEYPEKIFNYRTNVFTKFFKKEIIKNNNLQFDNIKSCNDVYFSYATILKANNIFILSEDLYTYRKFSVDNISSKRYKYTYNIIKACEHIKNELIKDGLWQDYKTYFREMLIAHQKHELSQCSIFYKLKHYALVFLLADFDIKILSLINIFKNLKSKILKTSIIFKNIWQ